MLSWISIPSSSQPYPYSHSGGRVGGVEENNPGHLEKGRIIEPFISHNSERPYINNKRNKPKRHTMTQMCFC